MKTYFQRPWRTIRDELSEYGGGLAEKHEIIVLTKRDALTDKVLTARRKALSRVASGKVHAISAHSGEGVTQVLRALWREIEASRASAAAAEAAVQAAAGTDQDFGETIA